MFNVSETKITIISWVNFLGWLVIGWTLFYGFYYNTLDFDSEGVAKFFGLLTGGFIGWVQGVLLNCLIYHLNNQEKIISRLDSQKTKFSANSNANSYNTEANAAIQSHWPD